MGFPLRLDTIPLFTQLTAFREEGSAGQDVGAVVEKGRGCKRAGLLAQHTRQHAATPQ